jgi:transcriptional regulator with GAF, ATPase, and Fis domain
MAHIVQPYKNMHTLRTERRALDRAALIEALIQSRGDVSVAARALAIGRRTAHRWITQYQIDVGAIRRLGRDAYPLHQWPLAGP